MRRMRAVARRRDGRCGAVVVVRAGAVGRRRRKFAVLVREPRDPGVLSRERWVVGKEQNKYIIRKKQKKKQEYYRHCSILIKKSCFTKYYTKTTTTPLTKLLLQTR